MQECIQLIKDLCAIPSFSHHELEKAKFIQNWFKQFHIDAIIDEVNNVIVPMNIDSKNEIVVFAAHIDTVFPDEKGFACIEKDGKLYAPGVGDDTANVAHLMLIARDTILNCKTEQGIIFLFNSCEEGLGNLKGSKHFLNTYKNISEFYTFDLGYDEIICKAVGSIRYKITIETEGGHSYGAFGNTNAIAIASEIISKLYEYEVPTRGKSTYNVGIIDGGTSVNTIAQNCSFLFEYRSDSKDDLDEMKQYFKHFLEEYQSKYELHVDVLGERPCMGDVNPEHLKKIVNDVVQVIEKHSGKQPKLSSGSTDCNASYALGIPGCCFGGYLGKGEHTYEEYIELSSLEIGYKILSEFVKSKR